MGGFDADLPLFRDDIDFCWRARAAGYEVRVITDAVVYHREMSARQSRKAPAAGGRPRMADRRGALYVFAVNLPLGPMITIVGGCVAGSLLRAAYFLVTKQQHKAWDQLGALAWLLRHPVRIWRARRRRAPHRKYGWSILRDQTAQRKDAGPPRRVGRHLAIQWSRLRHRRGASRRHRRAGRRHAAARHRFGRPARPDQPGCPALRRADHSHAGRGTVAGRVGAERFGHAHRAGRSCPPGAAPAICGASTWRVTTRRASARPSARPPTWA